MAGTIEGESRISILSELLPLLGGAVCRNEWVPYHSSAKYYMHGSPNITGYIRGGDLANLHQTFNEVKSPQGAALSLGSERKVITAVTDSD